MQYDLLPIRGMIDAGDTEQARRLLTEILRQNPKNAEARALLERCNTLSFLPPPPPPVPILPMIPMQSAPVPPAISRQVENLLKETLAVFTAQGWKMASYAPTVAIVEREQRPRFVPSLLILLFSGLIGGIFVLYHLMDLGDLQVFLIPQPDGTIRVKKEEQVFIIHAPHEVSQLAETPFGMTLEMALLLIVVGSITTLAFWGLIIALLF